jgi:hypothetical protein
MAFFIHVLPDVVGEPGEFRETLDLPRLFPSFSLPKLEDKPQDPIITALSGLDAIYERQDLKRSQNVLPIKRVELVPKIWSPQHPPPDVKASVQRARCTVCAYYCLAGRRSLLGQASNRPFTSWRLQKYPISFRTNPVCILRRPIQVQ